MSHMKYSIFIFVLLLFFQLQLLAAEEKKSTPVAVKTVTAPVIQPTESDVGFIRGIDLAYQKAKTVTMDIKKTLKSQILDSNTSSSGKVMFSKGRMRMEMAIPDKSLVVIDKKHIWVVNYPSGEFKNSALQVIKADISSKKGRSQNFLGLLTQGGVLKYFNVSGLQKVSEEERVFFLQPNEATVEFKRAQMILNPKTKLITGLRYWDELDNETDFQFSNVKFNKDLNEKNFSYSPPKNADITVF
jgi:outer membrane lipoprotein-sorting protein